MNSHLQQTTGSALLKFNYHCHNDIICSTSAVPDDEQVDATTSKTTNRGRRKRKSKDKDDMDAEDIDQGTSLSKSRTTKKRRLLQ